MGRLTSNEGFTLIEVLVAVTIFAIGLLSIAGMQLTGIRYNASANVVSVGSSIAQGVMEEILARPSTDPFFDQNDASPVAWDFDGGTAGVDNLTIQGAGTYSATIQRDADNPVNNVTRVDVVVTNTGAAGGTKTITLTGFKRAI